MDDILDSVGEICRRYEISALGDFLETCRSFAGDRTLNIAVLGRFKAGKSSFLNHLLGQPFLPVGAIPVTSVVTEIQYGPDERAEVRFLDGHAQTVALDQIDQFISEARNPENVKGVSLVRVELPSMERYRGARFVDTPGLDSALEHNTEAALEWLPNVGLAMVSVAVDPPLAQQDIELIGKLRRYTPNICLLLTKVDVLEEIEREQVEDFVRRQLARSWNGSIPVFPYSVRPGFENLRMKLDRELLSRVRAEAAEQHAAILRHKLESLLAECAGYLNVALRSAEVADFEREELTRKILGERESIDDTRLALRLIVRHAAATCRAGFESLLRADEVAVRERLLKGLDAEFPAWVRSLAVVIGRFEEWLDGRLLDEMGELSAKHREEFVEPARRTSRQLSQSLQDFRNRLSDRVLETLGVPLRTTEVELRAEIPRTPDVRVGKIFDRNWELLSFLVPMLLVKGAVKRHFERKVSDAVFVNLSRLASQWADVVSESLLGAEKEAIRRLDGLLTTIERLIAAAGQQAPRIREDLERLGSLRARLLDGDIRTLELR